MIPYVSPLPANVDQQYRFARQVAALYRLQMSPMTRKFSSILTAVLLAACSGDPAGPSVATIERIESRIAKDPCVGDLDRWHREYAFRKAVNRPADRNDVQIWFTKARSGDPAGRFVRETTDEWPIDDSVTDMVFARYDIRQDRLVLAYCGPNFGPDQPERVIR
jgi:hypothetical protein